MRFITFDSYKGMPPSKGVDTYYNAFAEGSYNCSQEQFFKNLESAGVDLGKVVSIKGFFEDTLNCGTANKYGMERASVVYIDSDLYESAKLALEFVTPMLIDGSIIIFDEWYQFCGNPQLGEQRAFNEWRLENPQFSVQEFQKQGPFINSFIVNKRSKVFSNTPS